MEIIDNSYCRFCAEPRSSEKLLNLLSDGKIQDDVTTKLTSLNAMYVDVSNHDSLPKTICFICYDSLTKAYEFLEGIKRAQDVLSSLFTASDINKSELSDDEMLDEIFSSDPVDDTTNIKRESTIDSSSNLSNTEVKLEPKEEKELDISYNNSVNVHDFLDAAICDDNSYTSATVYDKDKEISSWSEYPWVCSYCSIEFMDMDMLRDHVKIVHSRCSAHFCVDCKTREKDDFNSFVKHVRGHRKCLRKVCYYCNKQDENFADMKAHIKQHYERPQTACPLCGEILKNDEMLAMHLRQFDSVKQKRRPRRKAGTPITVEELTCDICKKVYKNPNSLRDHTKLHTINRKKEYTCDRCGKMFYNKGTLTSHVMSHDKIRPHLCRICNKSFMFPNMLRRHVEMHSGVKPFSCEQCGRCFRLQYQLNAHKIVHTDAMPYVCQYCNKAFRYKQILKNHERQHTGLKPYACQNCGMEFTNWSNYNKHMKRRHNTDTSKKKITPEGVFPINPETGQIIQLDVAGTEEWKTKIMVPAKRGKKKVIKIESAT